MDIKCSVFIAASVDGFIARPDGDIDWLHRPEYETAELNGVTYEGFVATVDALVMGRKTLEKVLSFAEWPYEGIPVIALSRQQLQIPTHLEGKIEVMAGDVTTLVATLAERGMKHLYIDGGQTIQAFLEAGLIEELIITRIPVLLGKGVCLFSQMGSEQELRHLGTYVSDNGFVQSRYQVSLS
ncbi:MULTISPECIES: dihydrofolate reductase family protein [unclassified Pseudomonas]|jgi:dihydrofolate reductase|uniref:dihydrofolate reductase family protein n=1 Tax=unclassified Pseudomonas TaxID=196821 RepID=UPI0008E9EE6C|nr:MULTISPECIES: dihydrofolate reductase family protein [unclassified Pseudomonas]PMV24853.1 dihydrofolate reductase [Pseudomonas sp. FW305-3-2-15-C-TSA2]PMV27700.1 dihydrofolate reductase [Pseudomonas sp. DP16D-L5]PMV38204.1 dihydrofolate reductase [Pseudomonas sp. FW305-3-2-15-A-LB2]PMV48760.1 dihydrofolate reductase [Pseudomonas sp. FW305-3-2-15-C-R2A1]PMV53623.1 dihydrofolate reductase [Pseudomonas sp. FW305-3-2-15-C-LB1]